ARLLSDQIRSRAGPSATEATATPKAAAAATSETAASTLSAGGADHAEQVFGGEVLLVDVVRQPDQRDAPGALKRMDRTARAVAGVGPSASEAAAKLPDPSIRARDDVERDLGVAVVEAGELGLVALALEHLDLLDNLG